MSKQEKVRDYILFRIINGEYPVGSRLPPEREIAQTLNLSRVTLRLALDALIGWKIIERNINKGYTVVSKPKNGVKVSLKTRKLAYVFYSSIKDRDFEQALSHSAMYKAIERSVLQNNDTLVFQTGESFDVFLENRSQGNDFDGVFITGTCMEKIIPLLMKKGIPFILLDSVVQGLKIDSVSFDDFEAGYICGKQMEKFSVKKLLYIVHYYEGEDFLQSNYTLRRSGMLHALEEKNISIDTYPVTCHKESYPDSERKKLLGYIRKNRIDGIVCGTYHGYEFLKRTPELKKIPLAAVNDASASIDEKDFSVSFDWNRLGALSARRMYEKLRDAYSLPLRIVIPVNIKQLNYGGIND